ncbi:IS1595 family transposase [Fibrella sp. HMF5335]|uniref:IS1595 family transposase n=1 Tax=Fibrella rubiginis TaxID=2817060 RepID=A0A939GE45_9BACT|nr:IS1595 family transposase [Fibrella rubiginis]MBO0935825.1 IS1595 family transposase [Fibrella rubiginis]
MAKKSAFTLADLGEKFSDELTCKKYLAGLRWKGGDAVCPHCGHKKSYVFANGDCKCASCRKKYSVRVGIIFAMRGKSFDAPMTGVVELDETYVGGKEANKHKSKRTEGTQGRSTKVKAPVFGMVECNGRVVAMTVKAVDAKTLEPIITQHIKVGAKIMTDEWTAYVRLHRLYDHQIVRHGQGEYVSGEAHTNTLEGFWSLLKRGIIGIYHHVSIKHLDQYVGEFTYRYNSRKVDDAQRFNAALGNIDGRLTYKTLIK